MLPVFQFVCLVSCPVTGHPWEETGSTFLSVLHHVLLNTDLFNTSKPPLSYAECSTLSQPPLIYQMLQALNHPHGPALDLLQCISLSCIRKPSTGHSTPNVSVLSPFMIFSTNMNSPKQKTNFYFSKYPESKADDRGTIIYLHTTLVGLDSLYFCK